jgi:hypothetical protein
MTSFRKINFTSIQLGVDDRHIGEPCEVVYKFVKYFQSLYNKYFSWVFPVVSSYKFLFLISIIILIWIFLKVSKV